MKNVKMILFTCLLCGLGMLAANAQSTNAKIGENLYVCAYNGLNLRASASTNSEVIAKLDHADAVTVLEVDQEWVEIDHRQSTWMKVSADGYTGYLFGGYLSSIEPIYLESYSFDCNTDIYYLDWVSEIIGDAPILIDQNTVAQNANSGNGIETSIYHAYLSGDVFYNKVGPQTDTYYFESPSLCYNDVLNFMEYMVACQNRFCSEQAEAIFRPIKNRHGQLVRVDCTTPLAMTAQQRGDKMVVKLETCL